MTDQSILDLKNPIERKKAILDIEDEVERNRQVALWACDVGFDELKPVKQPEIPVKVQEYYNLFDKDRKKMNDNPEKYAKFWLDDEVMKYFSNRNFSVRQTKDNERWLKQIRLWLSRDDTEQLEKINDRLLEFNVIVETPMVKKINKIFNARDWSGEEND